VTAEAGSLALESSTRITMRNIFYHCTERQNDGDTHTQNRKTQNKTKTTDAIDGRSHDQSFVSTGDHFLKVEEDPLDREHAEQSKQVKVLGGMHRRVPVNNLR
jgi:hypothetical protein